MSQTAYEQPTLVSYSSGGWEVQDHGTGRLGVWDDCFLLVAPSLGQQAHWGLFDEGTNPIYEGSTLLT